MSQNDIVRGKDDQKVKDLAYNIAGVAHQHLETVCILLYDITVHWVPLTTSSVTTSNGVQYKLVVKLCVKLFGHEK